MTSKVFSSPLRRMFIVLVLIFLFLVGGLVWMAGGIQRPRTFEEVPTVLPLATALKDPSGTQTSSSTITIVVWNIGWGFGWGSEGSGQAKPRAHFTQSLDEMTAFLKKVEPDLVLLQEVDFASRRSGAIDQAKALAEGAGLPYIARAESWRANWVPYPFWPIREHFGSMSSGGAILSRHPITSNRIVLLEKPRAHSFWYNLFYLFRYLQAAEVDIHGNRISVFNTHLEAFHQDNRVEQVEHSLEIIERRMKPLIIYGGDFNSVPPESTQRKDYEDEPETNHEVDPTVSKVRNVEGLSDSIPEVVIRSNERDYFTFPSHAPNRKLDYLFHGTGFERLEARVGKEAGVPSDHLPLVVRLRFR